MINFLSETTYREYFNGIADFLPGVVAYKYGDQEAKACAVRSDMSTGPTLWLDPRPAITGSGENDGVFGQLVASFVVMIPASDKHDDLLKQEVKRDQCTDQVLKIFRKIRADFDAGVLDYGNDPIFPRLKFGTSESIHFGSSEFVGCAAELPFKIPLNI